jgi:hypothetical protein
MANIKFHKKIRRLRVQTSSALTIIFLLFSVIIMPSEKAAAGVTLRATTQTAGGGGASSITLTKPTGTVQGDVMIAVVGLSGNNTITDPGGWTTISNTLGGGTNARLASFYKVAGASEPATYVFTISTNTRIAGGMLTYYGVDTTNVLDVTGSSNNGTSTSVTATSVTTTRNGSKLVGVFSSEDDTANTYTPPTGMDERIDVVSGNELIFNDVAIEVADKIQIPAQATGDKTATVSSSAIWNAHLFALNAKIPTIEQSGYRFSINADNTDPSYITDNLTSSDDTVRGTAFDPINNMFFTVGDNGTNWVIEKRRIADGSLCTSTNCGTTFGTAGRITQDIASSATEKAYDVDIDASGGYIYVVGMDNATGAGQWHIEKRDMLTGNLVTSFDTDGIVTSNPSSGLDEALTLQLDTVNGYLYVGGYDNSGNNQWNMQKYRTDNGAICTAANCGTAFDTDGIYIFNASNGDDRISAIEIDPTNTYLYVAGFTTAPNGRTEWNMQKMRASDAALCTAANCGTLFGTAGTYSSDPTTRDDQILALQVDSAAGAIYIGGYEQDSTNSKQWRIEKITLDTGTLVSAFGGSGCATNVAGAICQKFTTNGEDKIFSMELDGSGGYLYVLGIKDEAGTNSEWRVQKRNRSDGSLVSAWASSGTASVNPSVNKDPPASLVIDVERGLLWATGGDRTLSTTNMQWYFIQLNLDTGTTWLAAQDTAAGVSTNVTFRLRLLTHVLTETIIPVDIKLQFSPKVGTCDTAFVGESYADVSTSSGEIQYHDNPSVTDATAAVSLTGDPVHSGHTTVTETIEESNNSYPINDVPNGQDGLWDFVLKDSSAFGAYCFRLINSDNTNLNTYSVVPEITFCKDDPKTSALLRHGTYFCEGQKKSFFWSL